MELLLVLLAFALLLGLTAKRFGFAVYASMFVFASVASLVFLVLYRRLFS